MPVAVLQPVHGRWGIRAGACPVGVTLNLGVQL